MVAAWLKENLDSGTWEEIQWFPAVELKDLHEKNRNSLVHFIDDGEKQPRLIGTGLLNWKRRERLDRRSGPATNNRPLTAREDALWNLKNDENKLEYDLNQDRTSLVQLEERGVRKFCGMKFRTANALGAKTVRQMVFDVGKHSVRELKTGDWFPSIRPSGTRTG